MSIDVRHAVVADAPRLAALLDELGYGVEPEMVEVELRGDDAEVVVADDDGVVVGLLAMHTRRHFQRAAPVLSIDALVVGQSHRGRGVGAMLVHHAVDVAMASGAKLVDLNSSVTRVDARRFYERLGFEVVSHHFRRALADR